VRVSTLPRGTSKSYRPCIPLVCSVDHLVLSLNLIENIPPLSKSEEGTETSALGGLAHIKSLALSSNNLHSWTDIDALADYCPILETLNTTGNPIVEGQLHSHVFIHRSRSHPRYGNSEKHSRAISVAKLPALKSLNGGTASRAQPFLCWSDSDVTTALIL
jgi:hypothetical protein